MMKPIIQHDPRPDLKKKSNRSKRAAKRFSPSKDPGRVRSQKRLGQLRVLLVTWQLSRESIVVKEKSR